jgi:hypothetical protein
VLLGPLLLDVSALITLPSALALFGVWMTTLGHPMWLVWGAIAALPGLAVYVSRRTAGDALDLVGVAVALGVWAVLAHAAFTLGAVTPICID